MKKFLGVVVIAIAGIFVIGTAGPTGAEPSYEATEEVAAEIRELLHTGPSQQVGNVSEVGEVMVTVADGDSDVYKYSWKERKFFLFAIIADEAYICFKETKSTGMHCQSVLQEGVFPVGDYAEIHFAEEGVYIVRYNNIKP